MEKMNLLQFATEHTGLILAFYLAGTALFSWLVMKLFGRNSLRLFALLFLFNTLMVLVGPIMTLLLYLYLHYNNRKIPRINAHVLDRDQLQRSFPHVERMYGEGPLEKLLGDVQIPEMRKVQILTHITEKLSRSDVALLHASLSGRSDESRLLSFGVLNGMEQQLNDRISHLLQKLEHEEDATQKAIYEKEIAYLYREFVYYGLVSEELESFYLKNAVTYAVRALKAYPQSAELYLLLGKIYLYVKEYDQAQKAFALAMQDPRFAEETLPYMAELSFMKKDFKAFREILPKLSELRYSPRASRFTSLWKEAS